MCERWKTIGNCMAQYIYTVNASFRPEGLLDALFYFAHLFAKQLLRETSNLCVDKARAH